MVKKNICQLRIKDIAESQGKKKVVFWTPEPHIPADCHMSEKLISITLMQGVDFLQNLNFLDSNTIGKDTWE